MPIQVIPLTSNIKMSNSIINICYLHSQEPIRFVLVCQPCTVEYKSKINLFITYNIHVSLQLDKTIGLFL